MNPFAKCQQLIEALFKEYLPEPHDRLTTAMHYCCRNGGKRLRPYLVFCTGELFDCTADALAPIAVAVEMIHTYSLVHDDLPAMDNDDLRRGKPTCHKAFDEATAILAGDALLTLAFEILANPWKKPISPQTQLKIIQIITQSIGPKGMILGQSLDCQSQSQEITLQELKKIHYHKTGQLFHACIQAAALACEKASSKQIEALSQFAHAFGLSFQIQDDILDVIGNPEQTGKNSNQDLKLQKNTFATMFELNTAYQHALDYANDAIDALNTFGSKASSLCELTRSLLNRVSVCA